MNRLEEIRDTLLQLEKDTFHMVPYKDDVTYLLQRLERYEKALRDIAFGRIEGGFSDVRYFARVALNDEIT